MKYCFAFEFSIGIFDGYRQQYNYNKAIMMATSNNILKIMSDSSILELFGKYIKQQRLEQNKSQDELAEEAGINRTTLSEFENGKQSKTITLVRILRALNRLNMLEQFQVKGQISPLLLAKLERKKRKRASRERKTNTGSLSDLL